MLLAAVFPSAVLGVFTSIEGVISAANATFYVMLGSFLTAVPAMYLLFVMGGIGRTWESSVATIAASAVYLCYVFTITRLTTNVAVVWTADWIYYITAGIVLWHYWRKGVWRTHS